MDNLKIKEELDVMKAASLAGGKAPENIETLRARAFVHSHVSKQAQRRFFSTPVFYSALAFAACVVAAVFVFRPTPDNSLPLMQQDSYHASVDTLGTADSLKTNPADSLELVIINE